MPWPTAVDLYFAYANAQIVCRLQIIDVFETVKKAFEVNMALPDPDWKAIDESISCVERTLKDLNGQYMIPGDFKILIKSTIEKEEVHDGEILMNSEIPQKDAWV